MVGRLLPTAADTVGQERQSLTPKGLAALRPGKGAPMRKQRTTIRVVITKVQVNVALILFGIAAIISALR